MHQSTTQIRRVTVLNYIAKGTQTLYAYHLSLPIVGPKIKQDPTVYRRVPRPRQTTAGKQASDVNGGIMPCHASSSRSSRRRSPLLRLGPPSNIAARLDLDDPGERQAHELVQRFTTGRWKLWRMLGMSRNGKVLFCAVEWRQSSHANPAERYALAEVALDHAGVYWSYHPSATAALAALRAKAPARGAK